MLPVLVVGAFALALLLLFFLRGRDGEFHEGDGGFPSSAAKGGGPSPSTGRGPRPGSCTLCHSMLAPGERIKSDMFPGKGDRIMRIFGCPHCFPAIAGAAERRCPVCDGALGPEDHAIARYFERPGRRHVHVLGCTRCRGYPQGVR
jgi:hypothetical protein